MATHEGREQVNDQGHVQIGLAHFPVHPADTVGNGEDNKGGDGAAANGNKQGVHEHPGKIDGAGVGEQPGVVIQRPLGGEEGSRILAAVNAAPEGVGNQPHKGNQPDDGHAHQEDMHNNIGNGSLCLHRTGNFLTHYLKAPSSL